MQNKMNAVEKESPNKRKPSFIDVTFSFYISRSERSRRQLQFKFISYNMRHFPAAAYLHSRLHSMFHTGEYVPQNVDASPACSSVQK